jgi:type IV pilus assembly protein PilB
LRASGGPGRHRPQRLPKGLLDPKICQAYRVVVLSKRNNRLIVATADPPTRQPIEKIKFATQMGVDWVIAEYDKLSSWSMQNATSAEAMEEIIGGEFEFDESPMDASAAVLATTSTSEVDDAPVVKFLHKMLLDAFSMRASDLHFEPYEHTYRVRFASMANCAKLLRRPSPSRTSWLRASR